MTEETEKRVIDEVETALSSLGKLKILRLLPHQATDPQEQAEKPVGTWETFLPLPPKGLTAFLYSRL